MASVQCLGWPRAARQGRCAAAALRTAYVAGMIDFGLIETAVCIGINPTGDLHATGLAIGTSGLIVKRDQARKTVRTARLTRVLNLVRTGGDLECALGINAHRCDAHTVPAILAVLTLKDIGNAILVGISGCIICRHWVCTSHHL